MNSNNDNIYIISITIICKYTHMEVNRLLAVYAILRCNINVEWLGSGGGGNGGDVPAAEVED